MRKWRCKVGIDTFNRTEFYKYTRIQMCWREQFIRDVDCHSVIEKKKATRTSDVRGQIKSLKQKRPTWYNSDLHNNSDSSSDSKWREQYGTPTRIWVEQESQSVAKIRLIPRLFVSFFLFRLSYLYLDIFLTKV